MYLRITSESRHILDGIYLPTSVLQLTNRGIYLNRAREGERDKMKR